MKNFKEEFVNNNLRFFKIILENNDDPGFIRDMYDDKRQKWLNAQSDAEYKRCSNLRTQNYTIDECMNTPKNFYDFLVVNKKDIIEDPDVALTAHDVTPDITPAASPASAQGGTRRRRRNNKKSERKSKNNRKKTNRRR